MLNGITDAAKEKGYTFVVNPECEFFLFHTDENGVEYWYARELQIVLNYKE